MYFDHEALTDGYGTDGSTMVGSGRDHLRKSVDGITGESTCSESFNGHVHFIGSTNALYLFFQLKVTEFDQT